MPRAGVMTSHRPLLTQPILSRGSGSWPLGRFEDLAYAPRDHLPSLRAALYALAVVIALAVSLAALCFLTAQAARAETPATGDAPGINQPDDLQAHLAAIESAIEEKRKALGVQGASLAIVKDDKIIYTKGFGLRDAAQNLEATPDTIFAIGSASKAFTAMAAAMAADDGKISFDDAPRKFLPSFKIADPDTDANIDLRDLLSHRSGLERTDLVFLLSGLTREELIDGIGQLKPVAKLRQKFQYQNLMFVAAGEMVGRAENTSYEDFVAHRIFEPLGMSATGFTLSNMAVGYNEIDGAAKAVPTFDSKIIAPAGGIDSNARDMAQWVRFMLGGGVWDGKRLVSEKNFNELLKAQMAVSGKTYYGLGWFLHGWNGRKVAEHGGNLPGFTAQVGLMPSQKLGFVLLTNAGYSPIGEFAMETIWSNLAPVETPKPKVAAGSGTANGLALEAGSYAMPGGADFVVAAEPSGLTLTVPGQPKYPLEPLGKRRYKLGLPAPAGFFATFRRARYSTSGVEMFLEQPQGNIILAKRIEGTLPGRAAALTELVMKYKAADGQTIEIAHLNGDISLVVPGQSAYPLTEQSNDRFSLGGLPAGKWTLEVRRDASSLPSSIVLNQPNGKFEFFSTAIAKPDLTAEELRMRIVEAAGGEAKLRAHSTSVIDCEIELEGQGISGPCTVYSRAPTATATDITLNAFGKLIATTHQYFNGENGGMQRSGEAATSYSPKAAEQIKLDSEFEELLGWRDLYKEVVVKGKQRVGGEEAYIVEKTAPSGIKVTDYYSAQTFLQLRHDGAEWNDDLNRAIPFVVLFEDYRTIEGEKVPYKQIVTGGALSQKRVVRIKSIKWNEQIPDQVFQAK